MSTVERPSPLISCPRPMASLPHRPVVPVKKPAAKAKSPDNVRCKDCTAKTAPKTPLRVVQLRWYGYIIFDGERKYRLTQIMAWGPTITAHYRISDHPGWRLQILLRENCCREVPQRVRLREAHPQLPETSKIRLNSHCILTMVTTCGNIT